jgi:hypothetical protein
MENVTLKGKEENGDKMCYIISVNKVSEEDTVSVKLGGVNINMLIDS